MLYVRLPALIHLVTENLDPLTNISPFPHTTAPGKHPSGLCYNEFSLFFFLIRFHIMEGVNLFKTYCMYVCNYHNEIPLHY
jgi:hypothetical protein